MRTLILLASLMTASALVPLGEGLGGCFGQSVHTYGSAGQTTVNTQSLSTTLGTGNVQVYETNVNDCDGDGVGGDFDGDYDAGLGGGFFPWGYWAASECYGYIPHHDPNVAVNDIVWGSQIFFLVGEDDQSGPVIFIDPSTGQLQCSTDGVINPCPNNDPSQCGPTDDADDCLSPVYVGTGATCGTGGGDGGYWVILQAEFNEGASVSITNPATTGTISTY